MGRVVIRWIFESLNWKTSNNEHPTLNAECGVRGRTSTCCRDAARLIFPLAVFFVVIQLLVVRRSVFNH
jgi:hypothetical protein